MRQIREVFEIWPTLADLAREVSLKYQTVAKWSQRGRIPSESWPAVIEAAALRGRILTAHQLMRLNTPRGQANGVSTND